MTPRDFLNISDQIAQLMNNEPGLRIEVEHGRVLVGFWFDCATGRQYVCSTAPTLADAFAESCRRREDAIAKAEVEAEVRAEVERRFAVKVAA